MDGTEKPHNLIRQCPEFISSLFENAEEFMQLASTGYKPLPYEDFIYTRVGAEVAYQLISKQSHVIVRLFEKPEQIIQLYKIDQSPALALANLQSEKIASLFKNADEFCRLAHAAHNIAFALISKQINLIIPLFKNTNDIQKLKTTNISIMEWFILMKDDFEERKKTEGFNRGATVGLLKDIFPPEISAKISNFLTLTDVIQVAQTRKMHM